jgi:hypothetical protein
MFVLFEQLARSSAAFQFAFPMFSRTLFNSLNTRRTKNSSQSDNTQLQISNINKFRNAVATSEPEAVTPLRKTAFPLHKDVRVNDLSSVPIKNAETLAQLRAYLNLKSNLQHIVGKRIANEEDPSYFVVQRDSQRRKQQKNHHHKKGQVLCRLFNLGKFYSKPPNVDCF